MTDPIRIRASSWGTLFDCAYRWEGEQLFHMKRPLSHAMLVGKALHASTAAYDKGKADGQPISAGTAAERFVDTLWHPDEDVKQRPNEDSLKTLETRGLILHKRYCETFQYREYRAVELEVEPLNVTAANGVVIQLTGTLDRSRVRKADMGIGITDVKSGGRAVNSRGTAVVKNHHVQLGVYELLAEHSLGQFVTEPAEIIGLRTSAKPAVGTATIDHARRGLIGTAEAPGLIDLAASMLEHGFFPPNPSSPFCDEKFCPRWDACAYHA